jgi:hypothetical protein
MKIQTVEVDADNFDELLNYARVLIYLLIGLLDRNQNLECQVNLII